MTINLGKRTLPGGVGQDQTATTGGFQDDVCAFLAALTAMLRETVLRFEETVGRITEIAVRKSGQIDRDLVVALQDFDRLQQEFATLGDVLAHIAGHSDRSRSNSEGVVFAGHEAIAAIPMAHIKERLVRHLEGNGTNPAAAPEPNEEIF